MNETVQLLDPTAELASTRRERHPPPPSLNGCQVALLDIGKARGDVFLDHLDHLLQRRGIATRRYAKPTNTRNAPLALAQTIASEADVVVEALSD